MHVHANPACLRPLRLHRAASPAGLPPRAGRRGAGRPLAMGLASRRKRRQGVHRHLPCRRHLQEAKPKSILQRMGAYASQLTTIQVRRAMLPLLLLRPLPFWQTAQTLPATALPPPASQPYCLPLPVRLPLP